MQNKSHFGALIYEFSKSQGLNIRELSKRVEGTTPSTFSKIRAGNYSKLTEERLNRILDALAPDDKNARALMVCAYLWDICPAAYHTAINIEPRSDAMNVSTDRAGNSNLQIDNILPNLLTSIGKAASVNPTFFEHVQSLGKLAKEHVHDPQ
ncbi:hypothetical protein QEH59_15080 [Coraliomargarita sp. SDUM461004]|uniref:HTH cro/C1-type domain-containing protein n=1 Tax=Thalassobacterium sedimentorum TaxID=3041258 RepID=A0ABU1AM55_9BACT|nr:hypothetical protein [Coraliomargarita sp. SDUM461004]MDQ8195754.1 hypothetical protein [Coraliomargarita sp. SDUM461004]